MHHTREGREVGIPTGAAMILRSQLRLPRRNPPCSHPPITNFWTNIAFLALQKARPLCQGLAMTSLMVLLIPHLLLNPARGDLLALLHPRRAVLRRRIPSLLLLQRHHHLWRRIINPRQMALPGSPDLLLLRPDMIFAGMNLLLLLVTHSVNRRSLAFSPRHIPQQQFGAR